MLCSMHCHVCSVSCSVRFRAPAPSLCTPPPFVRRPSLLPANMFYCRVVPRSVVCHIPYHASLISFLLSLFPAPPPPSSTPSPAAAPAPTLPTTATPNLTAPSQPNHSSRLTCFCVQTKSKRSFDCVGAWLCVEDIQSC